MKRLILCFFIVAAIASAGCKSRTNAAANDANHNPMATKKDTTGKVKTTTPAAAATTPGAVGIGTPEQKPPHKN